MFCTKCGSSNNDAATFCVSCGEALPQSAQDAPKLQEKVEEFASDEEYYKAVIGYKNQAYYLDRFTRFDNDGQISATWHWPAFFVTFYWLLYRKMWLNAVIYFFLPYLFVILFGIVGFATGSASAGLIGFGYLLYVISIFILLPMYANALYYRQCKKTILAVQASAHSTQRQLGELSGKGGTSSVVIIFILIFTFIAMLGIMAAVAIPAYQEYTIRARTSQAVSVGQSAESFVGNYFDQYKSIPRSLETAEFVASLPPSVREVSLDSQTGTITVTMQGVAAVDGKSILFVPSQDAGDQLVWTCMSEEIQDRYLPRECRQSR